jgi:hypothetical protein
MWMLRAQQVAHRKVSAVDQVNEAILGRSIGFKMTILDPMFELLLSGSESCEVALSGS